MPASASLIIRTLTHVSPAAAAVPTDALRAYFLAFGVDLSFTNGSPLASDPTDSRESIREFVADHAPPANQGGPAILVVADVGYLGSLVNGMLLDSARRGACAVFTEASGFINGDADRRFEVYAHEIGHLLNLTHEDADERFTTAMDSWDERRDVGDRTDVWTRAIERGPEPFAHRLRGYFGGGGRQPLGLPLSRTCCDKLVDSQPSQVEPWRSAFEGSDPRDAADGLLQCELQVHDHAVTVAQPLDITVTLSSPRASGPLVVPPLLERTSGDLVIQLEQPDGTLRMLRPLQLSCTSGGRRLRPGQKVRRNDSFIADRTGLVFSMPGKYRVRALVPQAGSCSAWQPVTVAAASGALAEPAMQEFLRRGMPGGASANWRQLDSMLADKALAPPVRAEFSSRAAAKGRRRFEPLRHVRSDASPAVAELDALRRVAYLRRHAEEDLEGLHKAIDHAERLFAAADAQHPTLDYLAHVRRGLLARQRRRTK